MLRVIAVLAVSSSCLADIETFALDNGATIVVSPIEGSGRVGVESFYDVGFIDEPQGLTQIAHLTEHIMCKAALGDMGPGEAWRVLNAEGLFNAETLPSYTHYDASGDLGVLELIFEVEAGRLRGAEFDLDLLTEESRRCHAEAANIQATPQAPMFKFALMAAVQGWRYDADSATVVAGLERTTVDELAAFAHETYTPSRLTMVIVGDVDAGAVHELAQRTVGAVNDRESERLAPIDYAAQPPLREMKWDSAPATIIAYAPPDDPAHQLVLSLRGAMLQMSLMSAQELRKVARFTLSTGSNSAPVGPLPFMVYATLAEGADAAEAERVIADWVEANAGVTPQDAGWMKAILQQMQIPGYGHTADAVEAQAKQLRSTGRFDDRQSLDMVLCNLALQELVRLETIAAYGDDAFKRVSAMTAAEMDEIVKEAVSPDRRFITRLSNP